MTEPFIGEIQLFGFYFAPANWAFAAGQTMQVRQSTSLFALIGATYGGNGSTTFQLPNLASSQACGSGSGGGLTQRSLGQRFGEFTVPLTTQALPAHIHSMNVFAPTGTETVAPGSNSAIGVVENGGFAIFAEASAQQAVMSPTMLQPSGSGTPHYNQQPYLGVNYCIALNGVFPQFN